MLPDRVSSPGPPTYESGDLPIELHGPAWCFRALAVWYSSFYILPMKLKIYIFCLDHLFLVDIFQADQTTSTSMKH